MQSMLRSVDGGLAKSVQDALPARRTWRGFTPELADVLCIECTAAGLPMQAREEFALVLSKARMTDPQGHEWRVGPEEVGIAYPGEMYRIDPRGGACCVLLVAADLLAAPAHCLLRSREPLRHRAPVVRDAQLAARLHAVFAELRRGLTTLDALGRFRKVVAELSARHVACEPAPGAARRVHPGAARTHAYVSEHFTEAISLDDLTRVSRLSRFYVLRVFRREYGVSPHEYQRQLRLARACRLLAAGEPASRVAYEVGFSDQSHLIRQLKALLGITPGAFARQWTPAGRSRPLPAVQATG
ncbi:MAG TPA: AraC family transcriptional regulator [Longimicrobium sp.]|jgi:AraC-like DNA-binding protein